MKSLLNSNLPLDLASKIKNQHLEALILEAGIKKGILKEIPLNFTRL